MTRAAVFIALLGAGPWLAACDDEEAAADLHGSVSRVYPLDYQSVRARLFTSELAIQYVADREVIVSAVARLENLSIDGPTTVDLTEHGEVVGARGNTVLPPFLSGTLRLEAYSPTAGAKVSGSFDAVLEGDDRDYAVHGDFDTQLEDHR